MALALEMKGITKYFPSTEVLANNNVNFSAETGEVHALVGENGAGKTTLMNILYGLHKPDAGEIYIDSQKAEINHPDDALQVGIGMVHQHFKLVPSFTVAQNIMLGMEPNTLGMLRQNDEAEQVRQLAERFGLPVDPTARVRNLPVSMQQRVEILKSLQRDAEILILDEPTADCRAHPPGSGRANDCGARPGRTGAHGHLHHAQVAGSDAGSRPGERDA